MYIYEIHLKSSKYIIIYVHNTYTYNVYIYIYVFLTFHRNPLVHSPACAQVREHLQSLAGASLGFQEAWCLADEDQTYEDQAAQSHLQAL
jgi:hypothetical protein